MKILIANRGEIAVRIIRACREMGLPTVAVYSECDRTALHVRYADEAVAIGPNPPADSYLRIDKLIDVACRMGVNAVHPGYGFLAENADFARACHDAGLTFIGPSADVIELMGGKTAARQAAIQAGVPVVPGTEAPIAENLSESDLVTIASRVGYPLLVKAVAGGGGRGMRLVEEAKDLTRAVHAARSEAHTAFGNAAIYLERQILQSRHIEIQVLGDEHGRLVSFVERECSIQRRHQKVIEETPSVAVTPVLREALASAAEKVARHVGYTNAGTIEFLVDADGNFYFLEANTRLQVEHPITEMVTGVDLVQWQIRIARGEKLSLDPQRLLEPNGHAIECRVYAEDPERSFIPSPGKVNNLRQPSGPGIRDDSGITDGFEVPIYYDSLVSKVVSWAESREKAILRMARALTEYSLGGLTTTIPVFQRILRNPDFLEGRIDTTFLDRMLSTQSVQEISNEIEDVAAIGAALYTYFKIQQAFEKDRRHGEISAAWKRAARLDGLRT